MQNDTKLGRQRGGNGLPPHDVHFWSQNFHGSQGQTKSEEAMEHMRKPLTFALAIQETWTLGQDIVNSGEFVIIHHGLKEKVCNRGYLGVAIILGTAARDAWKRAGSPAPNRLGDRILAVRLEETMCVRERDTLGDVPSGIDTD